MYILKCAALLLICISLHRSSNIRCIGDVSCQFSTHKPRKTLKLVRIGREICEKNELSEMNYCECSYFVDSAYYIR